ncbi:hypothetical protein CIPAW_08G140200 [Carya illinoinensis]|uniref:Uncharacterized protein n=1 Tax=Carya illinoinensis TaxID=32201 RepID=A0A8T1PZI4_CARIL|nr:hypothetical protein CIPAW_08G140200 [Carya illinoinensis]
MKSRTTHINSETAATEKIQEDTTYTKTRKERSTYNTERLRSRRRPTPEWRNPSQGLKPKTNPLYQPHVKATKTTESLSVPKKISQPTKRVKHRELISLQKLVED